MNIAIEIVGAVDKAQRIPATITAIKTFSPSNDASINRGKCNACGQPMGEGRPIAVAHVVFETRHERAIRLCNQCLIGVKYE